MTTFTKTQTKLLAVILAGSGPHSARDNAARFRADNEEALDELDAMERLGILKREDNKYSLSLLALADLSLVNPEAESIYHLCTHLFDVLRRLYKNNPGQPVGIGDVARAAEFPERRVQRGISYLVQATRLWTSSSGKSGSIVSITLSEGMLRYHDFEDVVAALRDEQKQLASPTENREKQQKFGILDSPALLARDLAKPCGVLGRAVVYLDLDDFKAINTQLTEVVVDRLILPRVHYLLAKCVERLGSAYAEGGDEFTIYLPNATESLAGALAEAVRKEISCLRFDESASDIRLTVSIGVAHAQPADDAHPLRERANIAKRRAKETGKNRLCLWSPQPSSGTT